MPFGRGVIVCSSTGSRGRREVGARRQFSCILGGILSRPSHGVSWGVARAGRRRVLVDRFLAERAGGGVGLDRCSAVAYLGSCRTRRSAMLGSDRERVAPHGVPLVNEFKTGSPSPSPAAGAEWWVLCRYASDRAAGAVWSRLPHRAGGDARGGSSRSRRGSAAPLFRPPSSTLALAERGDVRGRWPRGSFGSEREGMRWDVARSSPSQAEARGVPPVPSTRTKARHAPSSEGRARRGDGSGPLLRGPLGVDTRRGCEPAPLS